jgi:hypothetical protein
MKFAASLRYPLVPLRASPQCASELQCSSQDVWVYSKALLNTPESYDIFKSAVVGAKLPLRVKLAIRPCILPIPSLHKEH